MTTVVEEPDLHVNGGDFVAAHDDRLQVRALVEALRNLRKGVEGQCDFSQTLQRGELGGQRGQPGWEIQ